MCGRRQATGAVRPSTATACLNDRAWQSPTPASGPGRVAASRPAPGRIADSDGVGASGLPPRGAPRQQHRPRRRPRGAASSHHQRGERPAVVRRAARGLAHVTQHLKHRRALPPGRAPTIDCTERTAPPCRSGRARRGRKRLAAAFDRRGRAVVAQGATGLEEDQSKKCSWGAAHVAEVRRRAQDVAVGPSTSSAPASSACPHHDLDTLDRVVGGAHHGGSVRAATHGVGEWWTTAGGAGAEALRAPGVRS